MFSILNLQTFGAFWVISIILGIWELIWKGIALWYASKDSKKGWFVVILIFNTIGILPIIYIYLIRKRKKKGRK